MDPISDMMTRIRNAGKAGKETVSFPYSKVKFAIATVLLKEGYVSSVKGKKEQRIIEIGLLYVNAKHKIQGVTRISKPSRRMYTGYSEIKPVRQGFGDVILSTPKGIATGKEARREKSGGEVLFTIW